MKSLFILLPFLLIPVCGYSQSSTCPQTHDSKIVLFVSPDSVEIDSMKQEMGDDFYSIADDAMYYRSHAYELIDLNEIEYKLTTCEKHQFIINGEYKKLGSKNNAQGWYMILWNGKGDPLLTYPINLEQHLKYLEINK